MEDQRGGCFIFCGAASAWLVSGGGSNPPAGDSGQSQRHELFISYSHEDEHWLDKLRTHLKPLELLYGLERWDDSLIQPGDKWLKEIETALSRAQVALLLVSPDFLASDFIQRKELPKLFRSAEEDGLKIIWLPLRPSSWKLYPQIEQYQAIISPAKSLAQMSEVDQDLAMVEITEKIQRTFTELRAEQLAKQKALQEDKAKQQHEEQAHRAERKAERQRELPQTWSPRGYPRPQYKTLAGLVRRLFTIRQL